MNAKLAQRLASWPGLAYFPSVRKLVDTGQIPTTAERAETRDNYRAWVRVMADDSPREDVVSCGRCGGEYPAGGSCSGPGYHP